MNTIRRGWWLLLLPLAACNSADEAPAEAVAPVTEVAEVADDPADAPGAGVEVSNLWVRAMPPSAAVAAGYLTLHNTAARPLRLLAVESPMASVVEIHEMRNADGMMQMRQVQHLKVPAGESINFAPGKHHLMLFDVAEPPALDTSFPVTIEFNEGEKLTFDVKVKRRT